MEIKKNAEEESKVVEYEKLKKTFSDLEKEERNLKEYLNTNVFDYAQNKQDLEDIFLIKDSSVGFFEQTKDCFEINPSIPILEVNNLTKYYASKKIPSLLNVSLKLYLGDLHVVVGSNGSGKTTLFNCLRGIENYDGEILIDGKEFQTVNDFDPTAYVAFVPSEISWDLYSTVEDVIFNRFQELNMTEIEAQNYIRSALEQFNLSHYRHCHIIDLSLLEKKKLQIIVALIKDPHLIVFDEIFLGLQQYECLDILVIFARLKQENRALLAFSYSFNDFSKFANTISIIAEGKIYYTGLVENLFLTQQNKYSIVTLDNRAALKVLNKIKCNYSYNELIDTIYAKFDGKLNLLLFQKECAAQNIIIHEVKPMETNLNDLYPVLTKSGNREAIKDINTQQFFTPSK